MTTYEYNRDHAVEYAKRWALGRNPLFGNFTGMGGDCANFASQCILAGTCQMNFTDTFGWYFENYNNRAPAWTGVPYLYNFLTTNKGVGPFGKEMPVEELELGDIIQLGTTTDSFYHTLVITGASDCGWLISCHTDDALERPLCTYDYRHCRGIHIEGFRCAGRNCRRNCFRNLIDGKKIFA